jgi:chromosome partitioning protein
MRCPTCLREDSEKKKFCSECGEKLLQTCRQCGSDRLPADRFCGECGQKLGLQEVPEMAKPACKVLPLKKRPIRRHGLSGLRADSVRKEMTIRKTSGNGSCRTIAICNQKGGVGKTVTTINLSAKFAASGLRTLLIDFDPQGQSGLGLGLDVDLLDRSVYDVLMQGACPIGEVLIPIRPNLDILPSNIDLTRAELDLASFRRRESRLKKVIDDLREPYDYVVIDCPPSIGILTVNALVASQIVIVPVTPSSLSVNGLSRVMEIADALKDSVSLEARVFSLFTFYERQLKEAKRQRDHIEGTFGKHLLKTVIHKHTKLNEAAREGIPVFEYSPYCSGGRDYADLADEIMSIEFERKPGKTETKEMEICPPTRIHA